MWNKEHDDIVVCVPRKYDMPNALYGTEDKYIWHDIDRDKTNGNSDNSDF